MRTFIIVSALVGATVLAGCGGTTDAGPPPSPSTSAVASTSPTPTAPALPDAAKSNSKAGAVAFVRFYIDAFNHAQATGDVSTLKTLGTEGCVSCNAIVKAINKTYSGGGHVRGGRWEATGSEALPSGVPHIMRVDVIGQIHPSDYFDSAGAEPAHSKGGGVIATFWLRKSDSWEVKRWTRHAEDLRSSH